MTDKRNISIMVATDEEGFALHRVRGPYLWVHMGRHFRRDKGVRLASAALAALHSIPFNLFARQIFGEQSAGKKLPVVLKSCDDAFLKQMERLHEITDDAASEWLYLKRLKDKYDLKLNRVEERSPAMERLKAFR
jgi:aminoglycoside phosphotransferase (APT) family kinase protein